jgi:hypothetical protein
MLCPAHILGYLSTVSRVRTGRYLHTIILPVLTKGGSEENLSSICQSRIIAVEARITLCKSSFEGAK